MERTLAQFVFLRLSTASILAKCFLFSALSRLCIACRYSIVRIPALADIADIDRSVIIANSEKPNRSSNWKNKFGQVLCRSSVLPVFSRKSRVLSPLLFFTLDSRFAFGEKQRRPFKEKVDSLPVQKCPCVAYWLNQYDSSQRLSVAPDHIEDSRPLSLLRSIEIGTTILVLCIDQR